ncbi:cytochrome bd oxidase small subunit CydS [Bacillus marinisedimentorum]
MNEFLITWAPILVVFLAIAALLLWGAKGK